MWKRITWHNNHNVKLYYGGNSPTNNDNEKKQHFLQQKETHKNTKEDYTYGSKSIGKEVSFAVVFTDITRREALPEEASIHTAQMIAIK